MSRLRRILSLLSLLPGLWACSPLNEPTPLPGTNPAPAPSATPPSVAAPPLSITASPSPRVTAPPRLSHTPSPPPCLSQPGRVEQGSLGEFNPAQEFLIYLPPCYDEQSDQRYPVIYLLHGQTYTDDQWLRLGAVETADRLILSGEARPFIMVFPDDRYWNLPPGPAFGNRLAESLVPYVDEHYRALADRDHRAIGGLSRGAGWALRLGLTRWDLFSALGLHSLAVFSEDAPMLENWLEAIPTQYWPRIYMDIGEDDRQRGSAGQVEALFTRYNVPHEWHLYQGDHSESYWRLHVEEYLRWYAEGW